MVCCADAADNRQLVARKNFIIFFNRIYFAIKQTEVWAITFVFFPNSAFSDPNFKCKEEIKLYFFIVYFTSCCSASIALERYTKGAFQLIAISLEAYEQSRSEKVVSGSENSY